MLKCLVMKNTIQIIKTLPHLTSIFLQKEVNYLYAQNYSQDIIQYLAEAEAHTISNLKFSELLKLISESKSQDSDNAYLEKYNAGIVQYSRVESVENVLEFSVKGDVISIFPPGYDNPVRIEFFGEDCEKIYAFDVITGRKIRDLELLILCPNLPYDRAEISEIKINSANNKDLQKIIFTNKNIKGIQEFHTDYEIEVVETDIKFPSLFFSNLKVFSTEVERLKTAGYQIIINSKHSLELPADLKTYILDSSSQITIFDHNLDAKLLASLPAGFVSDDSKFAFFTDRELFGSVYLNQSKSEFSSTRLKKLIAQFEGEIQVGDYVVHEDYGVAAYAGLKQESYDNTKSDYLYLKFDGTDELFVPINQIEKITKYLGNSDTQPKLTKLGKGSWKATKDKIKKSTQLIARQLVEHMAKREVSKAKAISKKDSDLYLDFVKKFKYVETKDQMTSINEVISDLENTKPMNRLLVGDVGFGKTEVAMRATFKIIEEGGQVAVLAPTTILTSQHYAVFKERFKDFAVTIKYLSRFNPERENRKIIQELNEGKVDIVIGTHRLLSTDIKFKKLELLIIDEEQKFGVKQKEKIKQLNYGVHLLSISATPIPRTLSMALSSIQEISIITTPPKGRKAIDTEIILQDWHKVANAIGFEISRGGQVYFLHNKVNTIQAIKLKLQNLMPGIKFDFAHGQMSPANLDRIMTDFYLHKFDCLICTTIIENGLDLPNVNTIIVNDSHRFGLSQLYQLRGRVGRSDNQAFCYLLAPDPAKHKVEMPDNILIDEKLKKKKNKLYVQRLQSLVENKDLGAGFQIASKDLEIRGAGTILGEKQHGHIAAIGYALYIEMLAHEIERFRSHVSIAPLSQKA